VGYPLDPSPEQMREMGLAALEYVIDFYGGLSEAPAMNDEGGLALARELKGAPPEEGLGWESVFGDFRRASAAVFETAGPGYLPFVPGGGFFTAALADFLSAATNRWANLWAPSPALVQMEQNAIRWIADRFGHGPDSRGILTSGGSMSNLSGIVTARRAKLGEDFLDGVYYVTDQAHASVSKAASIAGFSPRNVRIVPTDPELRMDPDALLQMVNEDRAAGHRPFLVVPSAGTTNTGAIDPIGDVVEVARQQDLWVHVDGAYGGFFQLTDAGRERFAGIEEADSIVLDPHKGLFLPYGIGCLIVRDGARLREAHFATGEYLQDMPPEDELPNFTEYSPELSRDFRGIRLWLPLQLHGVRPFREALQEKLELARMMADAFGGDDAIDVPWDPQLSVVAFRLADGDDAAQARFLDRINASKRVMMSSTMIRGRYLIRACILNHRTHRDRIDEAIEIVRKAAAEA
jgi:aromatic-L-amino-acid/L-tryptophan decarboxylase